MKPEDIIKVGVACLVFKEGKVLLGRRLSSSHGDGEYTCGGGHAEFMETLSEAARREIKEEWGIDIDEPEFLCATNMRKYGNKHYVDVAFKVNLLILAGTRWMMCHLHCLARWPIISRRSKLVSGI